MRRDEDEKAQLMVLVEGGETADRQAEVADEAADEAEIGA
jgi:hypothetical protein